MFAKLLHVDVSKYDDRMKATVKSDILSEDLIVQDSTRANIQDSSEANTNNNIENDHGDYQQETTSPQGQGMMVGAVTAALGASALVAHHQVSKLISKFILSIFSFCLLLHFYVAGFIVQFLR